MTASEAPPAFAAEAEWLETDGLGGYAMGTVGLVRTRRYHALLCAATTPPTGRMVLVAGIEVGLELRGETIALSSQRYAPDVRHPDGADRVQRFERAPWPTWTFGVPGGGRVQQEVWARKGRPCVVLTWRATAPAAGTLWVRPLLAVRDDHALAHENGSFRFAAAEQGAAVTWRPYAGVAGVTARSNGRYAHEPLWYRRFVYTQERARGLDHEEDLASPGAFRFDLATGEAVLAFALAGADAADLPAGVESVRGVERARRGAFASPLHAAADAYVARRGAGRTIIAGYPWFTDWGRDTFIAMRGLCLAAGRLDDARAILLEWSKHLSEGMLPNRFPDRGEPPEFHSVDAALWYAVAVHDYLLASGGGKNGDRAVLERAVTEIAGAYATGTRHGIRADDDGLLAAGVPGLQLTWMDAKIGDWVVTPRIGKPVELQPLWASALVVAGRIDARWRDLAQRLRAQFAGRFWSDQHGWLCDVIDVDHERGRVDAALRPNQVLAVGGTPAGSLLDSARAKRVVDAVLEHLVTPLGLRTLAPFEPGYRPRYQGGATERDAAYHQGTAWPWLMGPFVEAWLRTQGDSVAARQRFVLPLRRHLEEAGLGHVSEIADGAPPHEPRGCPFQAWSLGELLRIEAMLSEAGGGVAAVRASPVSERTRGTRR